VLASTLKIDEALSSETIIYIHHTTRRNNPESYEFCKVCHICVGIMKVITVHATVFILSTSDFMS